MKTFPRLTAPAGSTMIRPALAACLVAAVALTTGRAQPPVGAPGAAAPGAAAPGAAAPGAGGLPGAVAPAPATTYTPARMIGMNPELKRPLILKESERNPYAKRSVEDEAQTEEGGNAEEIEIRSQLSQLSVTGRSIGDKGARILLGDIIIEKGRLLPPLLPDQTEHLEVVEVNDDNVVLAWLDIETGKPTGKTMQISFDLRPAVSYALHGQRSPAANEEGESTELRMGVRRIGEERERLRRQLAEKDPARELPAEVYQAGQ